VLIYLIDYLSDKDYILWTPHKKMYWSDDNMCCMITDYFREIT
jgi:hypothetical protein